MEAVKIEELKNFEAGRVIKQIPILTDQVMVSMLTIDTGTTTPGHVHEENDELHYIVEGSGYIYIGDNMFEVTAGMLFLVPKEEIHYFKTENDRILVLTFANVTNHKISNNGIQVLEPPIGGES
jgi:mannose-6-phosphate isomerase-like protein (cupin superfamily)